MSDENNPFFLMGAVLGEKSGEVTDLRRRIEALEAKLAEEIQVSTLRRNHIEFDLIPDLHHAESRIEALTAERDALAEKLDKATRFVRGFACRAKTQDHGPDEMGLIDLNTLRFQRDCDIVEARATLAEITGGKTDG